MQSYNPELIQTMCGDGGNPLFCMSRCGFITCGRLAAIGRRPAARPHMSHISEDCHDPE
jgi:hypothetical protein